MSIWQDPEFQNRVKQLLIYSAEYIETDAECYRESNAIAGVLSDDDQLIYQSELNKVKEFDQLLTEIEADKGASVVPF